MKIHVESIGDITLTNNDFIASGGEGAIYKKDTTAYKIYTEPRKMIPVGKIHELASIADPNVIKPEHVIFDKNDKNGGTPVGYTMRYVNDTTVLCQTFTKSFRDRNNITNDMMLKLVQKLQKLISNVHKAKVLAVDLNEMNFLVNNYGFNEIYAIDVDSYQTPHYPATALMETIRDRHNPNKFSEATDWFAFAIVSFQMFIGIHPYKGKHPTIPDLDTRMMQNVSVLYKERGVEIVGVPKACYPFSVIPKAYLDWYNLVLEKGERIPPPADINKAVIPVAAFVQAVSSDKIDITDLWTFYDRNHLNEIVDFYESRGKAIILTKKSIFINNNLVTNLYRHVLGAVINSKDEVVVINKDGIFRANTDNPISFGYKIDDAMSYNGRFYVQNDDKILEVVLAENIITAKVVANIHPNATKLYPGVVIQNLLGAAYVSVFPETNTAYQVRIREIEGSKVVDAKFDSNVLMVVVSRHGAQHNTGKYERLVVRFNDDYSSYDIRVVQDITPTGLNFVVLDTGVCVCLNENDDLEIFSAKIGSSNIKIINDKVLSGDMRLYKLNGKVVFTKDNKIYRMSLK